MDQLKKIRTLLIFGPVGAGALIFGASYLINPYFTATARFLPPQQQQSSALGMLQSLGAMGGIGGAAAVLKNPTDQYIGFLRSRSIQDQLVEKYDLQSRYSKELREDARAELEKNSQFSAGKEQIISVAFTDEDPKVAAAVANDYVAQLAILLNRLAVTEAQQRRLFFEQQLQVAKQSLTTAQQQLAQSGVSASTLNAAPATAVEGLARLRAQIAVVEVKISALRTQMTDSSQEVRAAQAELSALKNQIAKVEVKQVRSEDSEPGYIARYREFKYQEGLFEMLSRQYEIARIDESREGAVVQVLDHAVTPERKAGPRRIMAATWAFLAVLAILLALSYVRALKAISSTRKDIF